MVAQVFISYSKDDADFAETLRLRLEKENFSVWTYDDGLVSGEDWRVGIDNAIKSSLAVIVVMTPSAKNSEHVTYEWAFAWGVGVAVIPLLLTDTKLHPRIEVLQYLDFTKRPARPWDKLFRVLGQHR